jgi:hypothetical protein
VEEREEQVAQRDAAEGHLGGGLVAAGCNPSGSLIDGTRGSERCREADFSSPCTAEKTEGNGVVFLRCC